MAIIIGVRFREVGRVYYFDPGQTQVNKGDRVIVETARGMECGEVVQENTELPEEQIKRPLKQMIRVATREDLRNLEGKEQREADAFKVCEEKILKHGLDMKLVNVEYTFDASKIIFHFTADQRVDFRALVRDLAGHFRTRIELRQIGVRDEAKLLGGLGVCGRPFCCSLFMGDFHPVSIKMAKEQGLSLNPTKISGTCGRLMCCLKHEEAAYEDALKDLPRPGSFIDTPEGKGMVTEVNAISRAVKVKLDRRPEAAPQVFQHSAAEGLFRKQVLREGDALAEVMPELRMKARPEEVAPLPAKAPASQPQRHHRRPEKIAPVERPAQAEKPARVEKPIQAEKTAQADKPERREDQKKGKNWRERHAPRKQEPAYRQPAPPQQQQQQQRPQQRPQQPQKPQQSQPHSQQPAGQPRSQASARPPEQQPRSQARPQPPEQQPRSDVKSVPRYGEVRRANAPQQPQQNTGGANYQRQLWQRGRGDQRGKGQQGQEQQKKDGK